MHIKENRTIRAITRVELLIIIAIVGLIAAPVCRVVFAHEFRAFDEGLFRWLGIDPNLGRFLSAVFYLTVLTSLACWGAMVRRRQRMIAKLPFLRLPRHGSAPKPNPSLQPTAGRSDD